MPAKKQYVVPKVHDRMTPVEKLIFTMMNDDEDKTYADIAKKLWCSRQYVFYLIHNYFNRNEKVTKLINK